MPVRGVHGKDSRALDIGLRFPGTKRTRTPFAVANCEFFERKENTPVAIMALPHDILF